MLISPLRFCSKPVSLGKFDKYLGYYHEYYYSMSTSGQVLRGLVRVFARDGAVYHERLERFPPLSNDLDQTYKCKYIGAAFYLNDRIFLVDYESLTANEICQTILFPTYRNKVTLLSGLVVGAASNNQRSIACARVAYEFLGTDIDIKCALRSCGLFDPERGEIDPTILKLIDNSTHTDKRHFYPIPL
ncbi:MAG: XRE family transcriptional regulator [Pseudomonadota bacterium]